MTNMEFLSKLIGDSAIDTWTSWETQEINNLQSLEKLPTNVNPYKFLYSSYQGIIILLDNKSLEENPNLAQKCSEIPIQWSANMGRGILGSNPLGLTILKSTDGLSSNTNSSLWICIYANKALNLHI